MTTAAAAAAADKPIEGGDGLLRLSYALSSNNQHKENDDLMRWLETATVDDLRLAFPILLNWCRNRSMKTKKSSNSTGNSVSAGDNNNDKNDNNNIDTSDPVVLKTTTTTQDVSQRIIKVLEGAIEDDAEETMGLTMGDDDDEIKKKNGSVSSLRMALAGYLHTNHDKMRSVPIVGDLERRTKAKVMFDRAATNTLNMVNAASPSSLSISQYIVIEDNEDDDKSSSAQGWGIPHINIDLGLGLQQSSPADVCEEFIRDKKKLLHPFTGEKVGRMEVKKVFPSKRKPVWIQYYSDSDSNSNSGEPQPLKPDVLAKQGDDLRNDASVTSVSKLCENIWAVAPIEWILGVPPTVCAYDVLVTAPDAGYLEMVPGKNFLELSQKISKTSKTGWEEVDIKKLAPSLVGSYIVNFVLGVRDRHEDNMMVVGDLKDDPKMMQIDFGYVLMEFPGGVHFDMPRLTMPIALVDRFNSEKGSGGENSTLMEDLQHDMLAAYLVLRRHANQIIPFCAHLMSSSYEYKHVEAILRGRHVFRCDQSEKSVIQWMSQKLTNQWAHFYFRREVKQGMVSGYYNFIEKMTFEKKDNTNINNNKDEGKSVEKERASGSNASNIRGKIRSFFGRKSNNNTLSKGGSFDDDNDILNDDSVHSVPDVVTTVMTKGSDSAQKPQPVFKKSRSQTTFVYDTSVTGDEDDSDSNSNDMSKLNQRVSSAMKLQKEVSTLMISQKEIHGTLKLDDYDDDDAASVHSI